MDQIILKGKSLLFASVAALSVVLCSCCATGTSGDAANPDDIFVGDNLLDMRTAKNGVAVERNFKGTGKIDGVDLSRRILLPKFEKLWFASADGQYSKVFPYVANRLNPWIVGEDFGAEFGKSPAQDAVYVSAGREGGVYALLKISDSEYTAILPITSRKAMSWLYAGEDSSLTVKSCNFGTDNLSGNVPLLVWATADNPYEAVRLAWLEASKLDGMENSFKFISEKALPEQFKYLGWCSWEQYHKNISLDLLCETVDKIEKSGVPVRWMLVDDGFQQEEKLRLKSFAPDEKRFPNGWEKLISKRNPDKIKWFGIWHCHYGLWNGIDVNNDLGPLNDDLVKVSENALVPGKTRAGAKKFYNAFIGSVADYGFDFVKIDVQTGYLNKAKGKMPNAVESNNWCSQALEEACAQKLNGLISCMAHSGATFFNSKNSSVIRCSVDYFKMKPNTAMSHLRQSYHNSVWLGNLYWPDHDMFHSSDNAAAKDMSISKALSGAPVYLSDDPKDFNKELIMRLCYRDGEILRPLAPAVPLPDSMFANSLSDKNAPYRVIAPLSNGCAAVMLHNILQNPDKNPKFPNGMSLTTVAEQNPIKDPSQKAWVSPEDYKLAGMMIRPKPEKWEIPQQGLVWYDWFAGKGGKLSGKVDFDLPKPLDGRLILIAPVVNDWAVIGLSGKYLSPASVVFLDAKKSGCTIKLREGGDFVLYLEKGRPVSPGLRFVSLGGGFWKANAPYTKFVVTRRFD